jgi:hypothetical protein
MVLNCLLWYRRRRTVCVTGVWAGVDSAWEQEKLEARKIPENAADSHTSGAPWNGGGRSFSTKERLAVWTKDVEQCRFSEKKKYFVRFLSAVLRTLC